MAAAPANDARMRGRTAALRLLYAWEANRFQGEPALLLTGEEREEAGDGLAFATTLFDGVRAQRTAVDAAIDQRLDNWTIHRLAVTDRAILRLGAYEILYCPDVPPKVAINEAVGLAKIFGSEEKSPRLVNGVLDRLARDHRPAELAKRGPPAKA